MVPIFSANSSARISPLPCRPMSTTSSSKSAPISVTSNMVIFMATRPTTDAGRPWISAHRELHFRIEQRAGSGGCVHEPRTDPCTFESRQRFSEPSKLRLSKGRIERVFDVGEVCIHALNFQARQSHDLLCELLKFTEGDA